MNFLKLVLLVAFAVQLCACTTANTAGGGASTVGGKGSVQRGASDGYVHLLRITARVDGSGKIVVTPKGARYEHLSWDPPVDVSFDGQAWANLASPPPAWRGRDLSELDFGRARILTRKGRDVIALEPTGDGFVVYFSDSPNGAGDYEVTIAIPRRR
jgi:hypothetical protein